VSGTIRAELVSLENHVGCTDFFKVEEVVRCSVVCSVEGSVK
jgi:hypothetical protein